MEGLSTITKKTQSLSPDLSEASLLSETNLDDQIFAFIVHIIVT